MNLASPPLALGRREHGTERLEEAVVAYRGALQEWTRDRMPLDRALTGENLATPLAAIAERTGLSSAPALAEIDAALEVFRAAGIEAYIIEAQRVRSWISGGGSR